MSPLVRKKLKIIPLRLLGIYPLTFPTGYKSLKILVQKPNFLRSILFQRIPTTSYKILFFKMTNGVIWKISYTDKKMKIQLLQRCTKNMHYSNPYFSSSFERKGHFLDTVTFEMKPDFPKAFLFWNDNKKWCRSSGQKKDVILYRLQPTRIMLQNHFSRQSMSK